MENLIIFLIWRILNVLSVVEGSLQSSPIDWGWRKNGLFGGNLRILLRKHGNYVEIIFGFVDMVKKSIKKVVFWILHVVVEKSLANNI